MLAELGDEAWADGRWENSVGQAGFFVTEKGLEMLRGSGNAASFWPGQADALKTRRMQTGYQAIEAASTSLSGCGGSGEEVRVKVAAELKSLACEPSSGVRVADLRRTLETNGIAVAQTTCGAYNTGRIAVCGVPDDALGFFEVPESMVSPAKKLGFFVASESPLVVDNGPCAAGR